VQYLGLRLTPEGILPGVDKLKAVKDTEVSKSNKEARQFTGLCNFFRSHIIILQRWLHHFITYKAEIQNGKRDQCQKNF
jgi:hypothetical protein